MKVGVFDSGLGGLTVVQSISNIIKNVEIFYIADTINAPYGQKSVEQILDYSLRITQYLINNYKIDALVVACNTATSASILQLRERYPNLIIIGTEPAVKLALALTKTSNIGVLATPATLAGDKYQFLIDKIVTNKDISLYEQACAGLVEHIENDTLNSKESLLLLEGWLSPMRIANVDTIVLGCTHYPLAREVIENIMNNSVRCIDSGNAIAQYLLNRLKNVGHKNIGEFILHIFHTGEIKQSLVKKLFPQHKSQYIGKIKKTKEYLQLHEQ